MRSAKLAPWLLLAALLGCQLIVDPKPEQMGELDADVDDITGDSSDAGSGDSTLTCASVLCREGTVCIETKSGPQCVRHEENDDEPAACAATTCPVNHRCVETREGAVCEPLSDCTSFRCEEGQHCKMIHPPCAPPQDGLSLPSACKPFPQCVDDGPQDPPRSCAVVLCKEGTYCDDSSGVAECVPSDVCAGVRCDKGYHCEPVEVVCVRAPCPPVPECVPDEKGMRCGPNVCAKGQVCCNESCGICTPPDGACIDLYCGPES